ncbi:hypothetical protein [Ensifer adhaerens]|uniref:hypothetical protein n=1 Tax=Ensifer adhaerens TaxID=106592 RepID=UPI0009902ACD|nr:hypothetical protein [Ensifer adhaerens]
MKFEIRGMKFFLADNGRAPFMKLALASIYIPDLEAHIQDVVLTWSSSKGWIAQAPYTKRGEPPMVQWNHRGAFSIDLARKMKQMYLAMGGKNPEASAAIASAKAGEIEYRTFPATFTIHEAANDNNMSGVLRTLGVEQEEAERACD